MSDDFWETYIPVTPEEDNDNAGCGRMLAWMLVAMLIVAAIVVLSV